MLIFQQIPAYTQDSTPPLKPNIKYVSIDTATNNVEIFWTPSSSNDVKYYNLYFEVNTVNGPEGVFIDTANRNQTSYTHEIGNAGYKSLLYSISAEDSSGNESLRKPGLHSTIYTTLKYDSCLNNIRISWNKYIGWEGKVSGYVIYKKTANDPFTILAGMSSTDSFYVHYGISENSNYAYYVEAIKNDGLISRSNIAKKYTYMPGPPEELVLDVVTIPVENTAEILFHYTDTSSVYGFSLLRSSSKTADFESVYQFFAPDKNDYILSNSLITRNDTFYYKIGSLNSCRKVTKESNLGVNIVLSGINNGTNNILSWNNYIEWDTGVEEYQLFRVTESGDLILLVSLDQNTTNYTDVLSEAWQSSLSGKMIYLIKAKKNGEDIFSVSNSVVVEVTTDLYMPNAFTPNGDQKNDVFMPVIRFAPAKYTMIIYDRSGFPIFQTNNIELGWDGMINGNGLAPQGVYIYHIQYTSFNGSKKSKTGNFTVFYP